MSTSNITLVLDNVHNVLKMPAKNSSSKATIEHVVNRARKYQDWDDEKTKRVQLEYERFLALGVFCPDFTLVPSADVDEVWHAHLLFTRLYQDHSTTLFGEFLHHTPAVETVDKIKNRSEYQQMLEKYREVFKIEPDNEIWPSIEDCGLRGNAHIDLDMCSKGCGGRCGGCSQR
jgi:hypothetical protein